MTATERRAPAPALAPGRPAHRDANVLRWLAAYTASMVGDSVYFVALSWAAARGGAAQTGLVLAVGAVPRAALMLGGGVVADRFGPRRVVIGSDAVRCAVVLALAALLWLTAPGLWLLAVVALVFGAVDALFLPAVGALPPRVTAPGQLARVQGLRGLAQRVATVTSAPLGGAAVAVGGPTAGFAVAGALFAVSLPLLYAVHVRELPADDRVGAPEETAWRQLAGGLRYIRGHRVLAPLMAVIAVTEIGFAVPANIGLVLLADERGWGAAGMGWTVAGFGVGAGLAALGVAVRGRVPRAGAVAGWVVLPGAAAVGALAFVPSVGWAVVAAVLVGLLFGLSGALCNALLQTVTAPAYMGRVTSVAGLLTLGVPPLCYPLTGVAIGAWGVEPVFVAGAVVSWVGAGVGLGVAGLRRAELSR
ncbi:MFS transporter [Streptomyces sp. NPDC059003]|uniref:MFS transporter n=1 Tax=Streptomyces sp. NPDC059003 TaxID=3346691 RepID=UPI00368C01AC